MLMNINLGCFHSKLYKDINILYTFLNIFIFVHRKTWHISSPAKIIFINKPDDDDDDCFYTAPILRS